MKKIIVKYRDEFIAEIKVKGKTNIELRENAINKFQKNEAKIECIGNCWPEYFEVFDENDNLIE